MRYTKDHEWVALEHSQFSVGVTEYAAEQLGDVVFVELPEEGQRVEEGDEAVIIESVKAASEIVAPASGEIVEVNSDLEENPGLINEEPQGAGWIFRMVPDDPTDYDSFLDQDSYEMLIS